MAGCPATRHGRFWRCTLLAAWLVLSLPPSGCSSPNTEYKFGFGTSQVTGIVDLGGKHPGESNAIVVVLKNHHTFITNEDAGAPRDDSYPQFQRSFTHPTAHVQLVGRSGEYVIDMPADVVSVDMLFLASHRLTIQKHFDRSVGIRRISFRAILPAMPNWHDHFYTFIEPQLQHLIVESRYKLSKYEQKLLGDWLDARKRALEAARK